jgi:hypothetical protein
VATFLEEGRNGAENHRNGKAGMVAHGIGRRLKMPTLKLFLHFMNFFLISIQPFYSCGSQDCN